MSLSFSQVKQIMEESVTRKFVHADSSHIISFCAVVEACVLHGLKRRAAGLLCSNKVAALFMKVGKSFTPAEELCQKVQELEQLIETNRQAQLNNGSVQKQPGLTNLPPQGLRNLWIRTALMEKLLDKIVMYLVENSSTFYDSEAILLDPVDGPILASLLVGPCALEYTKVKTADHFWTDPSADELVQRHRIHSGHCRQDSPSRRPALIQKRQSSGSMEDRPILWARDYVESLHQNNRATLLFGKNNVLVQPRDDMEAIPGYLSLHQTADLMTLKWTPNQLMNGTVADDTEKSVYWDFAMTIRLEEIVYLHCHQQVDSGGTVVLVSQDGIQRPPLRFPRGGHLLQFLTCLETGLLPHGQLDPPLWSQRGKGKVFPKLRKRSPQGSVESVSDKEEDEATDYVFRILLPGTPSDFGISLSDGVHPNPPSVLDDHVANDNDDDDPADDTIDPVWCPVAPELMDQAVNMWHPTPRKSSCFSCSQNGSPVGSLSNGCNQDRAPLKLLCDTMKYQIISRAFYGWLAYCRHLSTVRIHLSALVNPTIVDPNVPHDARGGLTVDVWSSFLQDCSAYDEHELLRMVYYGGVAPTIRKEVWPFLLGHYHFDMTQKRRLEVKQPQSTNNNSPATKLPATDLTVKTVSKAPESKEVECSESVQIIQISERVKERGSDKEDVNSLGNTETENKVAGNGLSEVSTTKDPKLPVRAAYATENTDILKLEMEVSNVYIPQEQLDLYLLNLHRIDKDVRRCDRTYWYFTPANLEKLRNIMCSYVWQHLEIGYVQGMCDLLAPLLVILDDEVMAFSCFSELMKRMNQNFPHGGAMDSHFANMRSLIQILDSELFELMQMNGDYTHFYFCYRWFLLDFKREMLYDDVFSVWESIWAATYTSSTHFVLFIALALVEIYRDIILENNMDFTDIIKFFNEMAEHHNIPQVLTMARDLVLKVQTLIENK
uniref:Small G protein signaling modulator 1-like n=1 Tax=Oncorhynchus tshawytscha TaxID=74940 RepID=A0A8C8IR37_ONCTS